MIFSKNSVCVLLLCLGNIAVSDEPVTFEEACAVLQPAPEVDVARDNPAGLEGRVMVGYQGWFRAEGDGSGLGFAHYTRKGKFEPGFCTIDLWPDLSEFEEDEKYPTAFRHSDGSVAHVFSSLNAKTVNRHFQWMEQYGIDGVFVQRFAGVVSHESRSRRLLKADNQKLMYCRDAANANHRSYALMYDLSGWKGNDFELLARDWKKLRSLMKLTQDPNDQAYLQFKGRPLVAIWGVGFNDDREYTLNDAERFIRFLKHNPEWGQTSIMLGVPFGWRMQIRDATKEAEFHKILEMADVISPWSVGRYHSVDFDSGIFVQNQIDDRKWCSERGITYLPVVYPGFSWHNMKGEKIDAIPRRGGRFFWDQFVATRAAGNRTAYVAMFDEIDEATAIFKCTNHPPTGNGVNFLDYEGLPADHYLR
ncbi:MAG: glycoside hydrolase family 71/99-like protein, partial [Verrucomicrobiales bacterium]|nr:glycoside hydrolase family 71/99-like protein [Verrucomicrobiales bacterium]